MHMLEVELPPLVRRGEDIPVLSAFFFSQNSAGRELALASNTSRCLANYHWTAAGASNTNALWLKRRGLGINAQACLRNHPAIQIFNLHHCRLRVTEHSLCDAAASTCRTRQSPEEE